MSPLPSRIIPLFDLWKGWQPQRGAINFQERSFRFFGVALFLSIFAADGTPDFWRKLPGFFWSCGIQNHIVFHWTGMNWPFADFAYGLWGKSLSMVILRDSRINPVFFSHVLPSIARALRRNCRSHGGIWLAHLSGARGALSLAWPVRGSTILVEAACKKPKKESRTHNPWESSVASFWSFVESIQFGFDLPSIESKSLKHFRATFSAAGPNSHTLPWPMKPAWYKTSPYAALVARAPRKNHSCKL